MKAGLRENPHTDVSIYNELQLSQTSQGIGGLVKGEES